MLCVDLDCLIPSRDIAFLQSCHTNYVIIPSSILLYYKIQVLFHWCFHDINVGTPICGVIVTYIMYIYYAISSKIQFVVENLCSIYLDSATKIPFSMACDLKRKQNQASPSYSQTPQLLIIFQCKSTGEF